MLEISMEDLSYYEICTVKIMILSHYRYRECHDDGLWATPAKIGNGAVTVTEQNHNFYSMNNQRLTASKVLSNSLNLAN